MKKERTPIEEIKMNHGFVLAQLYKAQKDGNKELEIHYRGDLTGIECCMDILGIEYEGYDPLKILDD